MTIITLYIGSNACYNSNILFVKFKKYMKWYSFGNFEEYAI